MIKDRGEPRLNHENSAFSFSHFFSTILSVRWLVEYYCGGNVNGLFCFISSYLYAKLKRWSTNCRWFWRVTLCVLIMSSQTLTHTITLYVWSPFFMRRKKNLISHLSPNDLISLKTGWKTFQVSERERLTLNQQTGESFRITGFFCTRAFIVVLCNTQIYYFIMNNNISTK